MTQTKKAQGRNKMGVMPIKRLLLSMAFPLMLSLVVQSLYNIVDSIYVAQIGENALAATSLAYPIQILMIALAVGTGVGINALISRLLGAGKRDEVGKAAATGVVLAVASSLVFVVVGLPGAKTIARALSSDPDIAEKCGIYLQVCMALCMGTFLETMFQRFLQASGRTMYSMLSLVVGAVMGYLTFFHGDWLAGLFAKDADVISAAAEYLKAYAIDCLLTSFLFCFIGYFNGTGNTVFVMLQGIIGAFGVRLPVSWIVSRLPGASLFHIGLATPASSIVQILLCGAFFAVTLRREKQRV